MDQSAHYKESEGRTLDNNPIELARVRDRAYLLDLINLIIEANDGDLMLIMERLNAESRVLMKELGLEYQTIRNTELFHMITKSGRVFPDFDVPGGRLALFLEKLADEMDANRADAIRERHGRRSNRHGE